MRTALRRWGVVVLGSGALWAQDDKPSAKPEKPIAIPADLRGYDVRELTLEDCFVLGLKNNVDLRAASVLPLQSQQDLLSSEAIYEPELYAEAGVARRESPSRNVFSPSITSESFDGVLGWRQRMITGGNLDVSYTPSRLEQTSSVAGFPEQQFANEIRATYTQPLLRGGWSDYGLAEIRAARSRAAGARHTLARTVQDTMLAIARAYWELVYARENYRVVQIALDVAEEQLRITNERIRVRDLAERDRIADEAEVARRKEERIRATAEVDLREDDLRRLLYPDDQRMWRVNLRPVSPYVVKPDPPAEELWRDIAESALRQRPDLLQLRTEVSAAEQTLVRAKRDLWPQLDLVGSYSTDGVRDDFTDSLNDTTDLEFPDWSLRLQFSIPIGNTAARAANRRAELGLERAQRLLRAAELDVAKEVRAAVRDLRTLGESIRAAEESVRLAETNLETEQIKLQVQATTNFEVQRRNQELREARGRLLRNTLDYRTALTNLEYVRGALEPPEAARDSVRR